MTKLSTTPGKKSKGASAANSQKNVLVQFFDVPIESVLSAHENDYLYDRCGIANEDDRALVESVRDHGIQEPLVLSADNYLLSGHRRLWAAKRLRLKTVPVRRIEQSFENLPKGERLALLRLYNQQRNKSGNEKLREKLLEIDPNQAYSDLLIERVNATIRDSRRKSNVPLTRGKKRAKITTLEFLEAVRDIIEENRLYWPLTARRVHYLLLNAPPLKHDKKPDSIYRNDVPSYRALTNLLARARLAEMVDMEAIEDSTRPIQLGGGFQSTEQFIHQETDNFLRGYSRNLMQGQPFHIEIMLEKNALRSVIEAVGREYCIPVTTGRGFASLTPRYEMVQRYLRSGKKRLVLLMLTDFDPDGDEIAASFANSLINDFGIVNIRAEKVALTAEDIERHQLPSDMDAKTGSPNYQKFLTRYGATKVVELDAAPVPLLQDKLREAIEQFLDVAEFNHQVELERQDAAQVLARRQLVIEALEGL